jgi:CRP/FNR family cyclic AMP-dependent transcriptional regulator
METAQLHNVLREIHFTAQMHEPAVQRLAEVAVLHKYPAGAVLFRQGAHNGDLFLLRCGRVTLEMNVPGRGKLPILTLGPGDMVAWSALIGSGEMTCTAVTLDEVEAITVSGAKLLELCQQDHEFGYELMRRMASALSRRLLATRLQLLDLFADEAPIIRADIAAPPTKQ